MRTEAGVVDDSFNGYITHNIGTRIIYELL